MNTRHKKLKVQTTVKTISISQADKLFLIFSAVSERQRVNLKDGITRGDTTEIGPDRIIEQINKNLTQSIIVYDDFCRYFLTTISIGWPI